jgi:MFS superfamily sulfate permease-like transporter
VSEPHKRERRKWPVAPVPVSLRGYQLAWLQGTCWLASRLLAVAVSVAELLVRMARPHDASWAGVPGLAGMYDVDDYPDARTVPGLVVYRYDAPLFFADAEDFRRRALAAADSQAPMRWFVLNVEANVEVDLTALEAVEAVRAELAWARTVLPSRG